MTISELKQLLEKATARQNGIKQWLSDNCPYVFADQKHLDENSPERAYWHHGYMMALRDTEKQRNTLPSLIQAAEKMERAIMLIRHRDARWLDDPLVNEALAEFERIK